MRATQVLRFHPLAWGAALLLKKWTWYTLANNYGWTRVYRRLMEQNRLINKHDPATRERVRSLTAEMFRRPTQIYTAAKDHEIARFAKRAVDDQASGMPRLVRSILETFLNSTNAGKVARELEKHSGKQK